MIEHTSGKSPLCEFNFIAHYETIIKATHVCNLFFFYTCTLKQGFLQVLPQTPYRITPCQFSLFFFWYLFPFSSTNVLFSLQTHTHIRTFPVSFSLPPTQRHRGASSFSLSFFFHLQHFLPPCHSFSTQANRHM